MARPHHIGLSAKLKRLVSFGHILLSFTFLRSLYFLSIRPAMVSLPSIRGPSRCGPSSIWRLQVLEARRLFSRQVNLRVSFWLPLCFAYLCVFSETVWACKKKKKSDVVFCCFRQNWDTIKCCMYALPALAALIPTFYILADWQDPYGL